MKHTIKLINRNTNEVVQEVVTTTPFPRTEADDLYRRVGGPHLTIKVETTQ